MLNLPAVFADFVLTLSENMNLETTRLRIGSSCLGDTCKRSKRLFTHALMKAIGVLAIAGIGAGLCTSASAASVIFTGSLLSSNLSASATFTTLGGGNLQVALANTYTGDTVDQMHVLTGVFFSGADNLGTVSATAGPGSVEWSGGTSSTPESSSVLGQQWEYLSGLSGAPGGATAGISSSGLGLFGHGNFATNGAALDGSAYGILSVGYAGSDLDGLQNRNYIQPAMVFVLSGFTGSLADISNVSFQYGTVLTEPNVTATVVPEPAPTALLAASIGLWAVLRLRRLRLRRAKN